MSNPSRSIPPSPCLPACHLFLPALHLHTCTACHCTALHTCYLHCTSTLHTLMHIWKIKIWKIKIWNIKWNETNLKSWWWVTWWNDGGWVVWCVCVDLVPDWWFREFRHLHAAATFSPSPHCVAWHGSVCVCVCSIVTPGIVPLSMLPLPRSGPADLLFCTRFAACLTPSAWFYPAAQPYPPPAAAVAQLVVAHGC